MQISRTNKSTTHVTLQISASSAELAPIKNHVLKHFAARTKVPGFRAGKAPVAMVEKQLNQRQLLDDFLEHAVNHFYRQALDHERLRPAAPPSIAIKKFVPFTELAFEVEVDVVEIIKLADYKKIKLSRSKIAVMAKEVEAVIKSLQLRLAERDEVTRVSKKGDELIIDFSATDQQGRPVSGAEAKDYPLLLGSQTFIPGFEDHLIGAKSGRSKEFSLKFPKDYSLGSLQNKQVTFSVNIKKVNELKLPMVDDEFAAKAGPFKNLSELKADIKKQLVAERSQQADRAYESELIGKIADASTLEIPEALIDGEISKMEEEEKRNLSYQGQTWSEHLKTEGISEQQHRQRQKPQATSRVKTGLVLSEIVERENVQVTPEEIDQRLQLMKEHYKDQAMQAELAKPEARREVAARLITEKTIDKLKQYSSK